MSKAGVGCGCDVREFYLRVRVIAGGYAAIEAVCFWEDIDGFVRNSPVMNVNKINTPLLFEVGDQDRNVDWRQGIELYNTARRAGKHMGLLVYADEGHGLRQDKNRIDYWSYTLHK